MSTQLSLLDLSWVPISIAAAYYGVPESLIGDLVLLREKTPVRAKLADRLEDGWGLLVWHDDVGVWLMTRREEMHGATAYLRRRAV